MYKIKPTETKKLYNNLKQSAKKRGIDFDLTLTDLNNLSFPITCPILGIPLKYNIGTPQDDSYSIDRKDNSIGYTIDNIEVISYKANRAKNNLSEEELSKLISYYSSKD
jgi:hypothetical protein